jgi:hypothetical protein
MCWGKSPTPPGSGAGANTPCKNATQPCVGKVYPPSLSETGAADLTASENYKDCPKEVKEGVKSKTFTEDEKKDVEEVLEKMKPLMKCESQPVKTIGRTDKAITDCKVEESTMGEWFPDRGALILSDSASNLVDFKDKRTQFKGTLAHELTHGLTNGFDPRTCKKYDSWKDNPLMKEWGKAADWDPTLTSLVDASGAPTNYAKTNPKEDLSESVMLYLYDAKRLEKASPARHKFVAALFGY